MLQTGRYLVSCYREAKQGVKMHGGVAYLNQLGSLRQRRSSVQTKEELVHLPALLEAYDVVTANLVANCGELYEQHVAAGLTHEQAHEECGMVLRRPCVTATVRH